MWRVLARFAMTLGPFTKDDGTQVYAFVVLVFHGRLWGREHVEAAIASAQMFPGGIGAVSTARTRVLVPYLVGPANLARRDEALVTAGRKPEGALGLRHVGSGLYLTLADDSEAGVQQLYPDDFEADGIDFDASRVPANAVIAKRLASGEVPVRVHRATPWAIPPVWRPGVHPVVRGTDTVPLLVVGPSWMAASAATSWDLATRARAELGNDTLRVLVPHRDMCFVWPTLGWQADRMFADGILRAEQEYADKPLSADIYQLVGMGIAAVPRSAFEQILFSLVPGATQEETEEAIIETPQEWRPPTDLRIHVAELAGASVVIKFQNEQLYNVAISLLAPGDWSTFERIDAALRAALPSVVLWYRDREPWSPAVARAELDGKGQDNAFISVPVSAGLENHGRLSGHAVAGKNNGVQHYGFRLFWIPQD